MTNLTVLQRERELNQYLFSGGQTAMLVLEDVRAGDILDYAYSIRGANPVGSGKFSHLVTVREHEPADRLTTRLLWPKERHLYVKKKGTDSEPTVARKGDWTEYTWDYRNVEGVEDEDLLPVWVLSAALGAIERVPNLGGGQPVGVDGFHQQGAGVGGFDATD